MLAVRLAARINPENIIEHLSCKKVLGEDQHLKKKNPIWSTKTIVFGRRQILKLFLHFKRTDKHNKIQNQYTFTSL